MKVYNLCCEHDHRFEGWFSSEDDFISQSSKLLVQCPICDNHDIKRLPSAPRLNLTGAQMPQESPTTQKLQEKWIELARKVMADTEDVGERFADEARRIHYKEVPERGIRGVATRDEREELAEEGIEVMPFVIPAALKQPLQ
jgi:hypothetical protein